MDQEQQVPDSDHFDVCRPSGPTNLSYKMLKKFLEERCLAAKV